jgi:hypothetical protein
MGRKKIIVLISVGLLILIFITFLLVQYRNFFPGKMKNIDSVKASCRRACSDKNIYNYCSQLWAIRDGKNPMFDDTCYRLATDEKYANREYGIDSCSEIECSE